MHITLGITLLLAIPFTYFKGSFEDVILLASVCHIVIIKFICNDFTISNQLYYLC